MRRKVLLIAYHFPPLAGSSGIQRTLRLVQHLPSLGWDPLVLTTAVSAYERTSNDLMAEVPTQTPVSRAVAFDAARQLAVRGRYLAFTARPDRWASWRFDAVRQGLAMIKTHRPDVLWSTYPIATAHMIGMALHRRSGIPWVADFRDPMAQDGYPADPLTYEQFVRIETQTLSTARFSTFTTPSAKAAYAARLPQAADRLHVIENGYDEASFTGLDAGVAGVGTPLTPGAITLLHSGIVYPSERDPTALMKALAQLTTTRRIDPSRLRLRFRAAVAETLIMDLAKQHGVEAFIECVPSVAYREALQEMVRADALLVMQAANCNAQIPAKIYEYLRAGRPMLGLAAPEGDTADVLRRAGIKHLAALESSEAIERVLGSFLDDLERGHSMRPHPDAVAASSRLARSRAFAQLFDAAATRAVP